VEQLVIDDLGVPWGDGKHLLKWREAIGIGQVELADTAGVSHQLISFIETEARTFTESAKGKLWSAVMRLGFERAKKGDGPSLADWQRVLVALSEIEEKKRADRTARWENLQSEWMKNFFTRFFDLPAIEAEMQRVVEEGQSSLELSKLIGAQRDELLPQMKEDALAYILQNPEKVLQEYSALTEWRQKILDLEAEGYALFLKSDVEAKDKRIAELERQLAAREQPRG
jgi:hypothetical protein